VDYTQSRETVIPTRSYTMDKKDQILEDLIEVLEDQTTSLKAAIASSDELDANHTKIAAQIIASLIQLKKHDLDVAKLFTKDLKDLSDNDLSKMENDNE
jgi:hypothetical protein